MKPVTEDHEKFLARCQAAGVNTDITQRWERGVPHHPKSVTMGENLECADWLFCSDFFGFKFGGDGDNGEFLLYELDIIFDLEDAEKEKS